MARDYDRPIARIVRDLGGPSACAAACGLSANAPGHWIEANRLPAKHLPALSELARSKGRALEFDGSTFRLTPIVIAEVGCEHKKSVSIGDG